MKRGLLLILSLLLCGCLCACSEVKLGSLGKNTFLQIEEASCSKAEAIFLLMEEKAYFEGGQTASDIWLRPVGNETMGEYIKDVVLDQATRYTAAMVMSDRLAVYPTEEAVNLAGEQAVAAWSKISSLYNTAEYELTASDVNDLYNKKAVYEAVYDSITQEATQDITEESTRVMLADYVVVPVEAGEELAQQLWSSVKEGADFSHACDIAGYPLKTGQVIKRGELNPTVDTIAFALIDGELSEVIESKDGYYVIHCLDDNLILESAANYNEVLSNAKEEAFKNAYYEFSKGAKLYIDNKFWDKIEIGSIQ
ncbi:MAG: hypothetical protein IKE48_00615 [Parasporobacterium sp.]|nr:hypothetical protein [Parasporobacterium sp.]